MQGIIQKHWRITNTSSVSACCDTRPIGNQMSWITWFPAIAQPLNKQPADLASNQQPQPAATPKQPINKAWARHHNPQPREPSFRGSLLLLSGGLSLFLQQQLLLSPLSFLAPVGCRIRVIHGGTTWHYHLPREAHDMYVSMWKSSLVSIPDVGTASPATLDQNKVLEKEHGWLESGKREHQQEASCCDILAIWTPQVKLQTGLLVASPNSGGTKRTLAGCHKTCKVEAKLVAMSKSCPNWFLWLLKLGCSDGSKRLHNSQCTNSKQNRIVLASPFLYTKKITIIHKCA